MIWWSLLIDEIQCLCEWLGEGEIEIHAYSNQCVGLVINIWEGMKEEEEEEEEETEICEE